MQSRYTWKPDTQSGFQKQLISIVPIWLGPEILYISKTLELGSSIQTCFWDRDYRFVMACI